MVKKGLLLILAAALELGAFAARAEVTGDDLRMLGLMFRNRYVPYSAQADANPEVKKIADSLGTGRQQPAGDSTDRYKALAHGMALMTTGKWNEGVEVSTIMDMRVPAKLFQPGETISVKLGPIYDRGEKIKEHYMVNLDLVDASGKTIGEPGKMHFEALEKADVPLTIPKHLAAGRYGVRYSIEEHQGHEKGALLTGQRGVYVISKIKERVEALAKKKAELEAGKVAAKSKRHELAANTVAWFLDIYQKGLKEDVPGAYGGHPMFMIGVLGALSPQMQNDRLDFTSELKLAEELAGDLLGGKDPLATRTGDMRLAYKSPADGELVPFRIYVPEGYDPKKTYPLAIGLHGAGGDENSFMDRYNNLFKENAKKHGYIVAAPNGRGPYGGYAGKSGQDPLDVIDLLQAIYPIDKKRTYLTGHSMGGFGTVSVGFNNADRFAALAPIAGFGAGTQLAKAKEMPLLIAQGDQDALVPVASARAFYKAAQDAGMPEVKYIEKAGVEHLAIPIHVMNDIFDWFDAHPKK